MKRRLPSAKAPVDLTWDLPRFARFDVELQPPPPNDQDTALPDSIAGVGPAYFAIGDPEDGREGVGFKLDAGSLYGVVHDGTTEYEHDVSTAVTPPSSGSLRMAVEWWPSSYAAWALREPGTAYRKVAQDADRTHHPSGETAADVLWSATLANSANSGDTRRHYDINPVVVQEEE